MFKFRLASVMNIRDHNEQKCRDEVGKCLQRLYLAQLRERRLEARISELEQDIYRLQQGSLALEDIFLYREFLQYQKQLLDKQRRSVFQLHQELKAARSRLFIAMREKKILHKLEAKKYKNYLYEQDKLEQAFLDELAVSRHS